MIIRCDNCSVSLQLDDAKVPKGNFTVRCPRCQNLLRVMGGARNGVIEQMKQNASAPAVGADNPAEFAQKENEFEINHALRSLLGALQKEGTSMELGDDEEVKPRRILLCLDPVKKDFVAGILTKAGYKVYAAETLDRKSTRLNSSHRSLSRMPSSA